MTLFTLNHPDNTVSTRESNKDLRWAVVVYTPAQTRADIRETQRLIDEVLMDNCHRALADGTVSYRDDRTYIGGLKAPDQETLLESWQMALGHLEILKEELPDLYQATYWFEDRSDAWRAVERLQDEYDATPWVREVYYTNELLREG